MKIWDTAVANNFKFDLTSDVAYSTSLADEMKKAVPFDITSVFRFVRDTYCSFTHPDAIKISAALGQRAFAFGEEFFDLLRGSLIRLPFPTCWFEVDGTEKNTGILATLMDADGRRAIAMAPFSEDAQGYVQDESIAIAREDDKGFFEAVSIFPEQAKVQHGSVLMVLFSLYLLNWRRDVTISEVRPSRQQRRDAARRQHSAPQPFHRIEIGRWVKRVHQLEGVSHGPSKLRMVRAHSASYSEQAPMFNCDLCRGQGHDKGQKPHIGNFWRTAHFQGLTDSKPYKIVVPEAVA